MEHWLKDESVDKCINCAVEFTFTERKHHCRDCGRIFCARLGHCSHNTATGMYITGPHMKLTFCWLALSLVQYSLQVNWMPNL